MLKPAILYKEEIQKNFQKYYYTQDMFYETGCFENWCPNLDTDNESLFNWAIVDSKDNLIGFLSYSIDFYSSNMSRFGLISFDRGNIIVGKSVFDEIERCIKEYHLHRVEWRMVGGNHAERGYDHFLKRYGGTKHILKDALKDRQGKYHDDIIYEIIIQEQK